jgi:hypothetical protein
MIYIRWVLDSGKSSETHVGSGHEPLVGNRHLGCNNRAPDGANANVTDFLV